MRPGRGPMISGKRPPPNPRTSRTRRYPAQADAKPELEAAAAAKEAAKAAAATKAATAKAASEAKLALEPVSIFISRARREHFTCDATRTSRHRTGAARCSMPAHRGPGSTIRDPDRRIKLHVFTGVPKDDGLRWSAVAIDTADDAEPLVITIPQEVLDRIAPTALPRSSIVISDNR